MNKTDLIRFLAKRCDLSLNKSRQVVENILDLMVLALKRGEVITLKGFGRFWANYSKSCLKCVPNSLNKVLVPAKFTPKFRCSESLKRQFLQIFG